jgi:hypothetical protein
MSKLIDDAVAVDREHAAERGDTDTDTGTE